LITFSQDVIALQSKVTLFAQFALLKCQTPLCSLYSYHSSQAHVLCYGPPSVRKVQEEETRESMPAKVLQPG